MNIRSKIYFSIVLTVVVFGALHLYSYFRSPVEASIAAQQTNGGAAEFAAALAVQHVRTYMHIAWLLVLTLIWMPKRARSVAPAAAVLALCVGCGPARYDKYVEIGPNETAFVIPLTGDTAGGQVKFNSVDYLNQRKVASKRIAVPLVKRVTGRLPGDYEWIDGIAIFKVNRSLVSREWTSGKNGTGEKNEGVPVVTKDGIQLVVGVATTVYIEEDDASTYLYYHGLQPLSDVTDRNIRNFCITELTREYGQLNLTDAKSQQGEIFARLFTDAKAHFKEVGITISQLGNAEGYEFKNPVIQDAINRRFQAEQDIQTATQEKLAQDQRNFTKIATAQTERDAAKLIFEAKEATTLQNSLQVAMINANARLKMAEKWDGKLPANILPDGSPLLLNLGMNRLAEPPANP